MEEIFETVEVIRFLQDRLLEYENRLKNTFFTDSSEYARAFGRFEAARQILEQFQDHASELAEKREQ
jgi:hypothetical protein